MAKAKQQEREDARDPRSKGFLNSNDAQAFLGVKGTTLYRLIGQGRLTKFKVAGRTVFSRIELEQVAKAS